MGNKISEEITGGEFVQEDEVSCLSVLWSDMYAKKGDIRPMNKIEVFSEALRLDYKLTTTTQIEPGVRNGKATAPDKEVKYSIDVKFPFKEHMSEGSIGVFVYVKDGDDVNQKILETIGNRLAKLEFLESLERNRA